MGQMERQSENRRANKRERAKEGRSRRAAQTGAVSWENFDWLAVAALTIELAGEGGALRLGKTRDEGAWALGVYLGDDYATEYIRPAEDFRTAIGEIAAAWLEDGGARYLDMLQAMDARQTGQR